MRQCSEAAFEANDWVVLYESLRAAAHVAVYLRRRLPDKLICNLSQLRVDHGRGSVEAVVEEISDIDYLRELHSAGITLYYGIGLPQPTTLLLDRSTLSVCTNRGREVLGCGRWPGVRIFILRYYGTASAWPTHGLAQ